MTAARTPTPARRWLGAALVVGAGWAGLAACGDDDDGGAAATTAASAKGSTGGLAGSAWVLATFDQDGTSTTAAAGATSTLAFLDATNLAGSTGCNSFTGTYTADGGKLTIALGAVTQMACADPAVEAQEKAILAGMPNVQTYAEDSSGLTLKGADDKTLFTYTAGLASLEGTAWKATGVNNGKDAVVSAAGTEKLTAMFGPGGQFSGFGGCNQLTGTYTTSGKDGLTITGLGSTKMMCEDDVMALEQEYIAALGKVATYQISGDKLNLRDSTGATQVDYTIAS